MSPEKKAKSSKKKTKNIKNAYTKKTVGFVIAALVLIAAVCALAIPIKAFIAYVSIPNKAYETVKPLVKVLDEAGATTLCSNGYNGRGNFDSNTPTYEGYYRLQKNDNIKNKLIDASTKISYKISELKNPSNYGVEPGVDVLTNIDPEQKNAGVIYDSLEVSIITSDQSSGGGCLNNIKIIASQNNPVVLINVYLPNQSPS